MLLAAVIALAAPPPAAHTPPPPTLHLERIARLEPRRGCEIVAYDPTTSTLHTSGGPTTTISRWNLADPREPEPLPDLEWPDGLGLPRFAEATSVAAARGFVAATIVHPDRRERGWLALADGTADPPRYAAVRVGHHPDMVAFTPDGTTLIVANEGEPHPDYSVDPPGSVTILRFASAGRDLQGLDVTTLDFAGWNDHRFHASLHRAAVETTTLARDLEPEFVAVSPDGRRAWITLQENNAIATVDLTARAVTDIRALGFKNHALPGQGLDASDRDGRVNIRNWPVRGLYQPDGIAAFGTEQGIFLITANEGDTREYPGYDEVVRVEDLRLAERPFRNARRLQTIEDLGRLEVTRARGDDDQDGEWEYLVSYGGRSLSIWTPALRQVWDSGEDLERLTAAVPGAFNAANDEQDSFDDRSDKKGPEPEGVVVGRVHDRLYAFAGLERPGGIVIYDVTDPFRPVFVDWVNPRKFGVSSTRAADDLGPEGLVFIAAADSPVASPLLLVANEVSGTVAVYQILTRSEAP